ncbi:GSU2403 family nucleotidyltransferase fold protein [Bradyrhizobium iriomotense]|uniref:GSU2403 family nucleotidyltransferase fold protein n=1 Tax=Bradyrhizobium iriomotense TaxID=441950 RepID=UPI001B8A35B7|nr:GSU2403 family nucleotidyltransferase fold protein [Bradyrhizobium iriomotense]MBR0783303.1 hypothetical protein [Bradyrhizobium iriomotense]
MNHAQLRHLEDVREFWERYEFLTTLQEKFRGAMGWKTVRGAEYLIQYWTLPETGKKTMRSLGRRSPETEKQKDSFDRTRVEIDKVVAEIKDDLEPLVRVGKALKIGRLEPIAADVLRELARHELSGPRFMIFGSVAMHLYEASAGAFLSRSILIEGDLDLLSTAKTPSEAFKELLPALRRADKSFELLDDGPVAINKRGYRVHLHTRRSFREAIEDLAEASEEQISVLHSLLDLEPVSTATVARDGSPVGMIGMDPRAFALTKHAVATLDGEDGAAARIAADQAYAVGRLVMKFGAKPFEAEHLEAFPGFAEQIDVGDPEATTMVRKFFGP